MHTVTWYFALSVSTLLAFASGFQFVGILRTKCKSERNIRYFTTTIFLTPIIVYLFFSLLVLCGVCYRTVSDCIAFGTVFGILLQLAIKPTGSGSIKLIAKQVDGRCADVWLDSLDTNVGEIRSKIAEKLDVQPSTRVSIESGKGTYLEDMNQKFFDTIDEALKKTDFFGHLNCSCYITVKEEEKRRPVTIGSKEGDEESTSSDRKGLLNTMLRAPQLKYGEFLVCSAKIASSPDCKVNLQISLIDKFVAGCPATIQLNNTTIRVHPWNAQLDKDSLSTKQPSVSETLSETKSQSDSIDHPAITESASGGHLSGLSGRLSGPPPINHERTSSINSSDAFSDGESTTTAASHPSLFRKMRRGTMSMFRPKNDEVLDYFGKPLRNGDIIVLETNGKYMSVTRGWWLAWNSNIPRRSGAFYLEIVEKAQNQFTKELKEQFKEMKERMKEAMGRGDDGRKEKISEKEKEFDNVLRPGDLFRLRSFKFPDFELGLTSVKLRDEYCYLGLRKIGSEASDDDVWCMEVNFTFRNANDILNQIINK